MCEGVENLHEDLLNYLYVKEFYNLAQIKCINMNVNFCVCAFRIKCCCLKKFVKGTSPVLLQTGFVQFPAGFILKNVCTFIRTEVNVLNREGPCHSWPNSYLCPLSFSLRYCEQAPFLNLGHGLRGVSRNA